MTCVLVFARYRYLPPIYTHCFVSMRFWRRQTVSLESSPMDDTNERSRSRKGRAKKYITNVRFYARFAYNYY